MGGVQSMQFLKHSNIMQYFFFVILCSYLFLGLRVNAQEIEVGGQLGPDIIWSLDEDGVLRLVGSGTTNLTLLYAENANADVMEYPWAYFGSEIYKVVIGEGITDIGSSMFYKDSRGSCYKELEQVVLPSTLEKIDAYAFAGCRNLRTVKMPKQLKQIERSAFAGCWTLKNITMPETVESIGDQAFFGCDIEGKLILSNVESIGKKAFYECCRLKQVVISDRLKEIGEGAFADCFDLEKVTFRRNGNQNIRIGKKCFYRCVSLTYVVLPDHVQELNETFHRCTALKKIKIPPNVKKLKGTFRDCWNLKKIILSSGDITITESVFKGICKKAVVMLPKSGYQSYKTKIKKLLPKGTTIRKYR